MHGPQKAVRCTLVRYPTKFIRNHSTLARISQLRLFLARNPVVTDQSSPKPVDPGDTCHTRALALAMHTWLFEQDRAA